MFCLWIELAVETIQDPVLSNTTSRIRNKKWINYSWAERHYKEIRNKLTIENMVVCNGSLVVHSEIQRRLIIKSLHDYLYCDIVPPPKKKLKSKVRWSGYSRDEEEYVKWCPKYKRNKRLNVK